MYLVPRRCYLSPVPGRKDYRQEEVEAPHRERSKWQRAKFRNVCGRLLGKLELSVGQRREGPASEGCSRVGAFGIG